LFEICKFQKSSFCIGAVEQDKKQKYNTVDITLLNNFDIGGYVTPNVKDKMSVICLISMLICKN